jgi:hypothetical protein
LSCFEYDLLNDKGNEIWNSALEPLDPAKKKFSVRNIKLSLITGAIYLKPMISQGKKNVLCSDR